MFLEMSVGRLEAALAVSLMMIVMAAVVLLIALIRFLVTRRSIYYDRW